MSTSLDYDLKRSFHVITREYRWNVLTVLILHANVRNRCWVSMDTIAKMATNGNRTKASGAKYWLEKHLAFEIVPNNKRVKEEERLSARLHVYQLLGSITPCGDPGCDCKELDGVTLYLHSDNRLDGQTIENTNNLDGQTMHRLDGQTINRLNGQTGSISNEVYPDEVKKKNTPKSPKGDSKPRPQSAQGKRLQYWQENSEALEVIRHGLRPGLPVTVLNETDLKALIALHQDGERMAIPAARYPRLFAYLRRKFDWKANYVPTISDARKYIGEWWAIEKATPVIVPQHPIQPAPERAKPGEIISREAQEEARRIFEDLVKLKDANG